MVVMVLCKSVVSMMVISVDIMGCACLGIILCVIFEIVRKHLCNSICICRYERMCSVCACVYVYNYKCILT